MTGLSKAKDHISEQTVKRVSGSDLTHHPPLPPLPGHSLSRASLHCVCSYAAPTASPLHCALSFLRVCLHAVPEITFQTCILPHILSRGVEVKGV